MQKIKKIYRFLLILLPVLLYFSYFPVIALGKDATMNFELSLPLIWLVIFDVIALIFIGMQGKLGLLVKKWVFLLFPIFASLSIIWSSNILRGILTAGMMWVIYIAVFAMVALRDEVKDLTFRQKMLKVFLGASLVVCAWCFLQCILDIAGVPRDCSLLCQGCVSLMFGFPHPNGFAVEPQFMGNLLLAPTIITMWAMFRQKNDNSEQDAINPRFLTVCFIVFTATLFLTFSRGAIYAFGVGMVFLTAFMLARTRKNGWGKMWKRVGITWGIVILSFVITLNVQGIMAEVGPTNDTYTSAIAKVLNHLSLGIIDLREKPSELPVDIDEPVVVASAEVVLTGDSEKEDAIFDGYVVESTEIRKRMTDNALVVWRSSFKNIMFGVGLGGAGRAMQEAGLIDNANEIVQNQYASLLLETGVVGVALLIAMLVFVLKLVIATPISSLLLTMFVSYGVSLLFFAGLPNALQIYLMPAVCYVMFYDKKLYDKMRITKDKQQNG